MKRRETGILGEKLARRFVESRGYRVIETNYRCPQGEIDIVATLHEVLVFIEVRTKKSLSFGSPEESITPAKREHLRAAAENYRHEKNRRNSPWRIDVVALELDPRGKARRIELIESAIGEE